MSQTDSETPPLPPEPPRLLIVDDSPEGRRSLARLLELYGFQVTAVADGSSALEALRATPPPQIVLTDLILPDLDGREVARAALALQPRPFVGLITGWSLAEEDPELQRLAIDQIFFKPLDIRGLIAVLRRALGEKR